MPLQQQRAWASEGRGEGGTHHTWSTPRRLGRRRAPTASRRAGGPAGRPFLPFVPRGAGAEGANRLDASPALSRLLGSAVQRRAPPRSAPQSPRRPLPLPPHPLLRRLAGRRTPHRPRRRHGGGESDQTPPQGLSRPVCRSPRPRQRLQACDFNQSPVPGRSQRERRRGVENQGCGPPASPAPLLPARTLIHWFPARRFRAGWASGSTCVWTWPGRRCTRVPRVSARIPA